MKEISMAGLWQKGWIYMGWIWVDFGNINHNT